MRLRRRIRPSSAPSHLPRPRRLFWFAWTAAGLAAFFTWLFLAPGTLAGSQGEDVPLGALRAVVVLAFPVVFASGAAYAFWRYRLEVLAHRPGPVLVQKFRDARTGDGTSPAAHVEALTSLFQHYVVESRLYGSTAIPPSGRSTDFLTVIEGAGETSNGVWGALSLLPRLLSPPSAYQVECTILPPGAPALGRTVGPQPALLVELTRFPGSLVAPVVIEDETWERVVQRAAHWVAGVILPRTRRCAAAPWTMWRGLRLHDDLFDLHQRFQAHKQANELDAAMAVLRDARLIDPGNLALRLELGKLQEQLGLHLDALATYDDVIGRASRGNRSLALLWNLPPKEWGRDDTGAGEDRAWSDRRIPELPARHPVVYVARYRHMLLLGLGEQLARQWWPRPVPQGAQQEHGIEVAGPCTAPAADAHLTVHERRAAYSRRVLAQRLKARYPWVDEELRRRDLVTSRFAAYLDDRDPSADTVPADRSQRSNHEQDLRIFLTTTSLCELELLLMERGNDAATSRAVRDVVSLRSLKVVLPWGIIRTARAIRAAHPGRSDLMRKAGESVVYSGSRPQIMPGRGERLLADGWPPNLEVLREYVTSVLGSSRLHSWHEHYNAACTYALPLLDEQVPAALTEQSTAQGAAADAAVAQLHKAVACGDSGFLAAQREWLLTEDPDLDVLRGTQQFFDLEAATFGSVSATESRGPDLVTWQIRTYATGLVHHVARCMRVEWAQRPSSGRAEREQVATWIELETAAWQIIERLCHEHDDSVERHRAVAALRSSGSAVLTTPSQVHPRFSRTLLAHQYDSLRTEERARPPAVQQQVRTVIDRSTLRFAGTVHALRSQQRGTAECCSRARELTPVSQAQRIRATLDPHATPQPEAVTSAGEVQRWAERSHACWIAMDALFDDTNPQPATMPVRLTDLRTALAR